MRWPGIDHPQNPSRRSLFVWIKRPAEPQWPWDQICQRGAFIIRFAPDRDRLVMRGEFSRHFHPMPKGQALFGMEKLVADISGMQNRFSQRLPSGQPRPCEMRRSISGDIPRVIPPKIRRQGLPARP